MHYALKSGFDPESCICDFGKRSRKTKLLPKQHNSDNAENNGNGVKLF
jgi:hypothetical protein